MTTFRSDLADPAGPSGPGRAPQPPSAGRVGRRRGQPSGRAVTGGFLVAAAVVAVSAAWLSAGRSTAVAYVVAARDLPPGARLGADDLTTEALTLPASGVGGLAYRDPSRLIGRVLTAPLSAGALVQAGDVAAAGSTDGLRPVVVGVAAGDASVLGEGSPVDVLVTSGDGPAATTSVVVTGARVLSAGRASSGFSGSSAVPVTLGVSSLQQVTAVVQAAHTGTVSVVVGAPGDQPSPAAPGTGPAQGSGAAQGGGA